MTRLTSLRVFLLCLLLAGSAGAGQDPDSTRVYLDVTHSSKLDFEMNNGMVGDLSLAEISGAGCALFDLEGDGDLDVYLIQGHLLGPASKALKPYDGPAGDRLFRNDAKPGQPALMTDVTARAGIRGNGYGMGVAAADIDSDGDVDLLVTNLGADQLWRNRGDGTFEEVAEQSGLRGGGWSTGASFADLDRDGDLDLYIASYVAWDGPRKCYAASSARDYCGPDAYPPTADRLYRNDGKGRFEEMSSTSGIAGLRGAGFAVVAVDLDDDGWLDLYVANDGDPNFLLGNDGSWGFENLALFAGTAVDAMGRAQASMGVTVGDMDGDGDFDLLMTHLADEAHTLYRNLGKGSFIDASVPTGITAERGRTGFGAAWVDYDNDGWLDLAVVNGAVRIQASQSDSLYPLAQANDLYRNSGGRKLTRLPEGTVPAFDRLEVSRGLAVGDIDSDGDLDLLLSNSNGPARILDNIVGSENSWIGLGIREGERSAIGALVVVKAGDRELLRRVHTDGSYLSSSDPRVLVGLDNHQGSVTVELRWVDGSSSRFEKLAIDRYHTLNKPELNAP